MFINVKVCSWHISECKIKLVAGGNFVFVFFCFHTPDYSISFQTIPEQTISIELYLMDSNEQGWSHLNTWLRETAFTFLVRNHFIMAKSKEPSLWMLMLRGNVILVFHSLLNSFMQHHYKTQGDKLETNLSLVEDTRFQNTWKREMKKCANCCCTCLFDSM